MLSRTHRLRRWAVATAGGLTLGLLPAWYWIDSAGRKGQEVIAAAADAAPGAPPAAPAAPAASALPVRDVVLFSSGVAYFERGGQVKGDAAVELKFKVSDINDLLKSLVVQDLGGGQVSTVTYGSRDPLTKTLRSFAVDLTANPTMGALLNQVRGESVQVTSATSTFTGTIIGVETKKHTVKDTVIETEQLNLLTPDGLRSIPLDQVQRLKLLNPSLDAELQQALGVLAGGHDTQKKTVGLNFLGQGEREVRVGYVAENPIWKTSYRLLVNPEGKLFMQGWAVIENTGDEDWNNVSLTLVSGRPISFIQDLYQPLYIHRPVVEPELYASLRPPVYDDAVALADREGQPRAEAKEARDELRRAAAPAPGYAGAAPAAKGRWAEKDKAEEFRMLNAATSAAAQATGAKLGELFRYSVGKPVTLQRQKSAMIPIINGGVEGKKVSIYNPAVQDKHPLSGLRLKNTTGLHLNQGPVTVYADGIYGGDARIEDLRPGDERLISYAIDLAVLVDHAQKGGRNDLISASLRKGVLHFKRRAEEVREYTVRNNDDKARTVLVEYPVRDQWKLLEPAKFEEKTPTVYRFAVDVPAKSTKVLTIREEMPTGESVYLNSQSADTIQYYIRDSKLSPAVKAAMERLVALKVKLDAAVRARADLERQLNEITVEQDRIRRNMAGLQQTSDLYIRYVKKLDDQETAIEKIRKDLAAQRGTEEQARKDVEAFLLDMNAD